MSDDAVRGTNDDATGCKLSAVDLGYYKDDFVKYFSRNQRKPPLINRGYYTRVHAISTIIERFLEEGVESAGSKRQIVNLGSGFDTLYWRLHSEGRAPALFVDVDFDQVTAKKCGAIRRHKELQSALLEGNGGAPFTSNGIELHAGRYHVVSADLRDAVELAAKLSACGVDRAQPTLFIAECVLIYLPPEAAHAIIAWAAGAFTDAAFVNYEQIGPGDAFGCVMLRNLEARQCPLLGIRAVPDLPAQVTRFTGSQWEGAEAIDMLDVWRRIPEHERARVGRLEIFDELEEWEVIMRHYCLVYAWRGSAITQGLPPAL